MNVGNKGFFLGDREKPGDNQLANEAHLINPIREGVCWAAWGALLFLQTREAHSVYGPKKVQLYK